MPRRNIKDYLAVVKLPKVFFERLMTNGIPLTLAVHGVRNIKILDVTFVDSEDMVVFLIYSEDIPAYVGLHNCLNDLIMVEVENPDTGDLISIPQLILCFAMQMMLSDHSSVEEE